MTCGVCGKVRAHLPEALRARLAGLEHRLLRETPQREDDEGDDDEEDEANPSAPKGRIAERP